ncbi:MAG: radical SAM protein [archaeon]
MSRVLFVDSLINREYEGHRAAMVSLVSALRSCGAEIKLKPFTLNNPKINYEDFRDSENSFITDIANKSPDYDYLLVSGWTGSWNRTKQIAKVAKQKNPKITVVIGGTHVDFVQMHRRSLQNPLDILFQEIPEAEFFAYGECEKTVVDLIRNGKIPKNNLRQLTGNLDDLPFPNLKSEELDGKRWAYVETARGCIYRCDFCSETLKWSNSYRRKSPKRVADEIDYYFSRGISHFRFTDSSMTSNPNLEEICEELINRGLHKAITWSGYARVNEVCEVPLEKMKEAGCETLLMGFESGSEKILKQMRKGYKKSQAYSVVGELKELGIKIRGSWIVGFPNESDDDFEETLSFARDLNLDTNAVHAYENQAEKFRQYHFGTLDFELDMPNEAFNEFVQKTNVTDASTEMHYLARLNLSNGGMLLSPRERVVFDKVKKFNESVSKIDQDYDTRDRYDRKIWEH